jgi:hypothetical protein
MSRLVHKYQVKELEKLRAALPKRGGGGTEEQLRSIDESLKYVNHAKQFALQKLTGLQETRNAAGNLRRRKGEANCHGDQKT